MFKYTVEAYNYNQQYGGAINLVQVIVTAPNEELAIKYAKTLISRTNYSVAVIEDLRKPTISKIKG